MSEPAFQFLSDGNGGDGGDMNQLCTRIGPVVEEYFDAHVMIGIPPGQLERSLIYISGTIDRPKLRRAMEDAVISAAQFIVMTRKKNGTL